MPAKVDHSGEKYGKWTILKRYEITRPSKYYCRCDCGKEQVVPMCNLTRGLSTQCAGCYSLSRASHLIGQKIHHLKILDVEKINGITQCKVQCDCGITRHLPSGYLYNPSKSGKGRKLYKSCGRCDLSKILRPPKNLLKLGNKKGLLTIVKNLTKDIALAKCECGKTKQVKSYHMDTHVPSCGCYWTTLKILNAKKLVGFKNGRLKIIKFLGMKGKPKKTRAWYRLRCDCGQEIEREIGRLYDIYSCGCLQKDVVMAGQKIEEKDVIVIKELFGSNLYTKEQLLLLFNLSEKELNNILDGKAWSHIKPCS